MLKFRFDPIKAEKLLLERNIVIEEVISMLMNYEFLDLETNSARENQYIFEIIYKNYPHSVRCVKEDDKTYFIKTIFADRTLKKKYGMED